MKPLPRFASACKATGGSSVKVKDDLLSEVERLKRDAAASGCYGIYVAIALSLICSLAAVAIISKRNLTNYLWVDLAAFAVPIPIALYFKNRIVLLGAFTYVAALILALSAALVFGI